MSQETLILGGTGHRPGGLIPPGTIDPYSDLVFDRLVALATKSLESLAPSKVISGMALGWDMALAQAAKNLSISLVAAIPFEGHGSNWGPYWLRRHVELCEYAEVAYTSSGGYSGEKLQIRNIWIVDHSNIILALWSGRPGGTTNCIDYAKSKEKTVYNVWGSWAEHSGLF